MVGRGKSPSSPPCKRCKTNGTLPPPPGSSAADPNAQPRHPPSATAAAGGGPEQPPSTQESSPCNHYHQSSNAQPPSISVPCNHDQSSFAPPVYNPPDTTGAGAGAGAGAAQPPRRSVQGSNLPPRPRSRYQPRPGVPHQANATGAGATQCVPSSSRTRESNPPPPLVHYDGMHPQIAAAVDIEICLRRHAAVDIQVSLESFPYHLPPSTVELLHLITHITLVSKKATSKLLLSGPPGSQIYQETLAMALAKEYNAALLIYDPLPLPHSMFSSSSEDTAEAQPGGRGVLSAISSSLVQSLNKERKNGSLVVLLSDTFVNDLVKSFSSGIASPSDLKGIFSRIPRDVLLLGSHINSSAQLSELSVYEFLKGDRLGEIFLYKVIISAPEDEAQASVWKQKLDKDLETLRVRRNRVTLSYLLGTSKNWSCGDLHAICIKKRLLSVAFAAKTIVYAILHHSKNNKHGFVISSESIKYGSRLLETTISDAMGSKKESLKDVVAEDEYEKRVLDDVIPPDEIGVTFDDIGALDDVKRALRESVVLPLRRPELFSKGQLAKPCRGVLLFGPPGTGKTMLAKAVAAEAGASFINVSMSSLRSKWYGEGEKYAKAVFALASKLARCVVFIDEVDSVLISREGDAAHGGGSRRLKNVFMVNWDGLRGKDEERRVLVLGATNRPFDLDEAVIRRFPQRLMVGLPGSASREKILRVILSKEELAPDVDLAAVASMTVGYSGSDMKHLCVVAAHRRIREILEEEEERERERSSASDNGRALPALCSAADVRPMRMGDFKYAHDQLGASASSEIANMSRLVAWNDQYGEDVSRKQKKVVTRFF